MTTKSNRPPSAALARSGLASLGKHALIGYTLAMLLALSVTLTQSVLSGTTSASATPLKCARCAGTRHRALYADPPLFAHPAALAVEHASAGEVEEGDEELEGGESEEAASAEAKAEEANSEATGSPSTRTASPLGPAREASVAVISQLKLTPKASAALRQRRPSVSTIGFSFVLSAPTKLRVMLVKQTSGHGRRHWTALPDSVTLNAGDGRVTSSLTGHNRLSPGHYRLTVKPDAGTSRSIYLSAHR